MDAEKNSSRELEGFNMVQGGDKHKTSSSKTGCFNGSQQVDGQQTSFRGNVICSQQRDRQDL